MQEENRQSSKKTDRPADSLTARELAEWFRFHPETIRKFAKQGVIPHIRLRGRYYFPKKQIDDWLERTSYRPPKMQKTASPTS